MNSLIHKRISNYLKTAVLVLSILSASAFFLGFLIVNIYLAQFGFWDFNFLRVQYISAGILFFIFIGITTSLYFVLQTVHQSLQGHQSVKKSRIKKYCVYIFEAILASGLLIVNYYSFALLIIIKNPSTVISLKVIFVFWIIVMLFLITSTRFSYKKIRHPKEAPKNLLSTIIEGAEYYKIIYIPLLGFALVLFFSVLIYPFIPRFLGGAMQSKIELFLNNETNLTSPVNAKLIYQSPDFLLINSQGDTYLFPSDQINNIKYLDSNPLYQKLLDFAGN